MTPWAAPQDARAARHPPGSPAPLFIVGCPRSGTTFLQARLAGHPQVISLPETNFFESLCGGFDRWLAGGEVPLPERALALARGRAHRRGPALLSRIAKQLDVPAPHWRLHWTMQGYVDGFSALMDCAARRHGRTLWIEKTPAHIAYIELIQRYLPQARFVHILRDGEHVISSALDTSLRYHTDPHADSFDHALPWWVRYWNRAMETHLRWRGDPRHHFVVYEDLVAAAAPTLAGVLAFAGLSPTQARDATVIRVFDERHGWGPRQTCHAQTSTRRPEVLLSPFVQSWLRRQLHDYAEVRACFPPVQGSLPLRANRRA